jgi:hypothetical protein
MEQVGLVLARPSAHSTQKNDSWEPKQVRNEIIARVWTRMAEVYGHKWVSQYGEVCDEKGTLTSAAKTWAQGLSRLKPEEISVGFSKIVEKGFTWPPSLPEFANLCANGRPLKLAAPFHKMVKQLPAPEVDPEIIRSTLREIRARMSSKN